MSANKIYTAQINNQKIIKYVYDNVTNFLNNIPDITQTDKDIIFKRAFSAYIIKILETTFPKIKITDIILNNVKNPNPRNRSVIFDYTTSNHQPIIEYDIDYEYLTPKHKVIKYRIGAFKHTKPQEQRKINPNNFNSIICENRRATELFLHSLKDKEFFKNKLQGTNFTYSLYDFLEYNYPSLINDIEINHARLKNYHITFLRLYSYYV